MNQLIVDSSVFISSLIANDANHAVSCRFFSCVNKKNTVLCMPISALFEVLHVYLRKTNSKKADELYQKIINASMEGHLRLINLESSSLVHFAAFHELFSIKTADAIIALAAHRLKSPLVTWDRQMLHGVQAHIKAMTPDDFIK